MTQVSHSLNLPMDQGSCCVDIDISMAFQVDYFDGKGVSGSPIDRLGDGAKCSFSYRLTEPADVLEHRFIRCAQPCEMPRTNL